MFGEGGGAPRGCGTGAGLALIPGCRRRAPSSSAGARLARALLTRGSPEEGASLVLRAWARIRPGLETASGTQTKRRKKVRVCLIFITLSLPSSPFSLRLLRLSHECYSRHPNAPAAHTWLRARTAVSVVPRPAAHVGSATAPSPRLPLHPSLPFPRPMPLRQSNAQVRFFGCRCCRCCRLFYPDVSAGPAAILRDISLRVLA